MKFHLVVRHKRAKEFQSARLKRDNSTAHSNYQVSKTTKLATDVHHQTCYRRLPPKLATDVHAPS